MKAVWLLLHTHASNVRHIFSWELEYGELLGMENLKACCAWPEGNREAIDRGPDTKVYL